jgi:hypothetical protein
MGDVRNTPHSAGAAVTRSRSRAVWTPDMCMEHVWWSLNGVYKYGLPDALAGWKATQLRRTDRTPPAGAPVYWTSPRQPHGHVALSVGGGRVRSTDWPSRGALGEVAIETLEAAWDLAWLGYGLDLAGDRIAGIAPNPIAPREDDTMELTPAQLDTIAKRTADEVWAKILTGHDEDGPGGKPAPTAPALSWLVMARRDAGRAMWNTDTLEAAGAQLRTKLDRLEATVAQLEHDTSTAAIAAFREALAGVRLELGVITDTPEETP